MLLLDIKLINSGTADCSKSIDSFARANCCSLTRLALVLRNCHLELSSEG